MRLSILVVSWNVRDLLRDCLASVRATVALPVDDYEVIVVDNQSHDGSADMVAREFPWVRLIRNSRNSGFGAANNTAFHASTGATVLLLNPDTVVLPGALDDLLRAIESDGTIGVIGSRLLNTDGTLQRWTAGATPTVWRLAMHTLFLGKVLPKAIRGRPLYLLDDITHAEDVDWLSGACLALRREALQSTIFDERFFMYGEDLELCHRLKAEGWRVVYFPQSSIIHHHGKSTAQSEDAQIAGLKGPRAFYRLHSGRIGVPAWDLLTAFAFTVRAIGWSVLSLTGRPAVAARARTCWKFTGVSLRVMLGR